MWWSRVVAVKMDDNQSTGATAVVVPVGAWQALILFVVFHEARITRCSLQATEEMVWVLSMLVSIRYD